MFRFEFLILNTNYFIYSRTHVVMELWSQMVTEGPGGIISSAMTAVLGSPENYVKKMRNHVEHVDQLFISMAACVLGQDIIILHLHNDTCSNGMYVLHPGGSFNSGDRSQENPIFVAYYEETRFFSGHYQAVEPVSNGPVLKDLLAKGGRDIAGILSLPEQSNELYLGIINISHHYKSRYCWSKFPANVSLYSQRSCSKEDPQHLPRSLSINSGKEVEGQGHTTTSYARVSSHSEVSPVSRSHEVSRSLRGLYPQHLLRSLSINSVEGGLYHTTTTYSRVFRVSLSFEEEGEGPGGIMARYSSSNKEECERTWEQRSRSATQEERERTRSWSGRGYKSPRHCFETLHVSTPLNFVMR